MCKIKTKNIQLEKNNDQFIFIYIYIIQIYKIELLI